MKIEDLEGAANLDGPAIRRALQKLQAWATGMETATGVDPLAALSQGRKRVAAPPLAAMSVTGGNGVFEISIVLPSDATGVMYHEIKTSNTLPFAASTTITVYAIDAAANLTIVLPNTIKFFQLRSRYATSDFNQPQVVGSVSSGAAPPAAHAPTHRSGGSDPLKLDDLASPDDNTDLNVSLAAHGLMSKLPGGTTNFYRADGTFAAPGGGGLVQYSRIKRTSGNVTTTSTTLVDLTGASITMTTGATRCIVTFIAGCVGGILDASVSYDLVIDGVAQSGSDGMIEVTCKNTGGVYPVVIDYTTDVLSAGSHTFKIQWHVFAGQGTGTTYANTTVCPYVFSVTETNLTM